VNRFIVLWLLVITESGVGDPLDYVADLHAYWLEELVIERSFDLWVTPAVEPNYVVGEQDKSYFVTYPQPQVEPNWPADATWSLWMRHDAGVPPFAWDQQWAYIQEVPRGTENVKLFCTAETTGRVNLMQFAQWRHLAYTTVPYNKD